MNRPKIVEDIVETVQYISHLETENADLKRQLEMLQTRFEVMKDIKKEAFKQFKDETILDLI